MLNSLTKYNGYLSFIITIVVVVCLAVFILNARTVIKINSASDAWLSNEEIELLKKSALKERNSNSARKLARYYERSNKNYNLYLLWLQRASNFGDPYAKEQITEMRGSHADVNNEINSRIEKGEEYERSQRGQ